MLNIPSVQDEIERANSEFGLMEKFELPESWKNMTRRSVFMRLFAKDDFKFQAVQDQNTIE